MTKKDVPGLVFLGLITVFLIYLVVTKVYTTPYDQVTFSNVVNHKRYIWLKPPTDSEVTNTTAGLKTGDIVEQNGHYYLVNPDGTGTEIPAPNKGE